MLNIVKDTFTTLHQNFIYKDWQCTPPVGIIFGYSSNTYNNTTFLKWFDECDIDIELFPGLICCLDQGLISVNVYNKPKIKKLSPFLYPYIEKEDIISFIAKEDIINLQGRKLFNFKNQRLLPFVKVGKEIMLIDQSKLFLNFILHLLEILKHKIINPNINFRKEYLSDAMKSVLINHEDKIKWRKEDYPQYSDK